jgi:hypothetical protein
VEPRGYRPITAPPGKGTARDIWSLRNRLQYEYLHRSTSAGNIGIALSMLNGRSKPSFF